MSAVAKMIREAREAQHLTVEQVAEITKIRTDHIRAIEEGNFEVFPAPVYARGAVRTYCGLVKLEVAPVLAALETELRQSKKFAEPLSHSNQPRGLLYFVTLLLSKVDWPKTLIGLAILLVLGAIVAGVWSWRSHRGKDPLSGLPPGVYQPTQGVSGETLPLPAPPRH
jgi:cytoskeletal protein RodZ